MTNAISSQSVVQRKNELYSQEVDNDIIILDVHSGEYFGSNSVGRQIWRLVEKPIQVSRICDELLRQFAGVERSQCNHDTLEFLTELHQAGLIEVVAE